MSNALVTHMTFNYIGLGQLVTVSGHWDGQAYASSLNFTSSAIYGNIYTYCVDLDNYIHAGDNWDANVLDSQSLSGGLKEAGNILGNAFFQADNADKAAGLQLAMWEAIYDGGATLDLSVGNFKSTGETAAADAWAQTYYAYRTVDAHAVYFQPVAGSGGQGQMTAVPEPATMIGLGTMAVALLKRKRR
ncbi:MAG: PEP-CTERM sorting domain-containing protein [Armatimonadetes bacterium]|nr:PEP-CTERM sorting domain-containing protein [Armatimonadota bacterium]